MCRIHGFVLLRGRRLQTVTEELKVTGQTGWANARTDFHSFPDRNCVVVLIFVTVKCVCNKSIVCGIPFVTQVLLLLGTLVLALVLGIRSSRALGKWADSITQQRILHKRLL